MLVTVCYDAIMLTHRYWCIQETINFFHTKLIMHLTQVANTYINTHFILLLTTVFQCLLNKSITDTRKICQQVHFN